MTPPEHIPDLSRRNFIKAGVATAAAAGVAGSVFAEEGKDSGDKEKPMPFRPLGKTGEKVSILNLGCGRPPSQRVLNAVWSMGVRYLDTADCYGQGRSEEEIAKWLEKTGRRKEFFIVDKDHPNSPEEWVEMVDRRLAALKTDYIDLFFIHGLGGGFGNVETQGRDWPKTKEWGAAADKMKKAGKIRFAGFSTHTEMDLRCELLNKAVEGGWVDAIMVAQDPQLVREHAEFNKALDACHQAGIGLISMKEMRGLDNVPKFLPEFKEMGLTPHQAVLHAVWSDERFATVCSDMPNLEILSENVAAAKNYKKPLDGETVSAVIGLYHNYARTFCNGCDGRCARAAGTTAALGDIARYLSYCEQDGMPEQGRALYAKLTPEQRNWLNADLEAASHACVSKLNFAAILPRAEAKLA